MIEAVAPMLVGIIIAGVILSPILILEFRDIYIQVREEKRKHENERLSKTIESNSEHPPGSPDGPPR